MIWVGCLAWPYFRGGDSLIHYCDAGRFVEFAFGGGNMARLKDRFIAFWEDIRILHPSWHKYWQGMLDLIIYLVIVFLLVSTKHYVMAAIVGFFIFMTLVTVEDGVGR